MKEKKYLEFAGIDFLSACRDYQYLLDHQFSERSILKLVGDRYKLSTDQRTVLYRGISSQKRSTIRNSLIVNDFINKSLIIDGYNVLLTLLNYRLGKTIFISTDRIIRDAGALHGKFSDETMFVECIRMLIEHLGLYPPAKTEIYLDSPVSHSERHARLIEEMMMEYHLKGDCFVIRSADYALKNDAKGIISTSDTAIIEKALLPVVDLPARILEKNYHAEFLDLPGLLSAYQT